jgi:uncharacterized protein (TIGR00645 family)
MGQIARAFESAIFLSRWLLAPFLVGFVLTLFLLIFRFFADFGQLAMRLPNANWHQMIVGVLHMIEIVLTGNLVLVAIFSGYQNFIHNTDGRLRETWPPGLIAVDLTTVKQRVFGTIMVIASIDALARYLDIEKENDVRLMWVALFALMFGVATVMLALADRIARRSQRFQQK